MPKYSWISLLVKPAEGATFWANSKEIIPIAPGFLLSNIYWANPWAYFRMDKLKKQRIVSPIQRGMNAAKWSSALWEFTNRLVPAKPLY